MASRAIMRAAHTAIRLHAVMQSIGHERVRQTLDEIFHCRKSRRAMIRSICL